MIVESSSLYIFVAAEVVQQSTNMVNKGPNFRKHIRLSRTGFLVDNVW